ncbi:hypothetical protein [Bacillus sp. NPDC077027]|uniref:hypothetical protein n=1 Tax=Bacillus sp. NPDC077027 TaxID=3390548 RepID=UPI003D06AAE1
MKRKAAKLEATTNNMTPTESMSKESGRSQLDDQKVDRAANRNSKHGIHGAPKHD